MIDTRSHALRFQRGDDFVRVVRALLANRQHAHLLGAEPAGECACEMLDEHADETLHRTKRRAMDHHWAMRLVVCACVTEIEAHGQVVINLHGAELPRATNHILHDEVNFRAVERRFTRLFGIGHAKRRGRITTRRFGLVPIGRFADIFCAIRIAQANANAVVIHAQRAEDQLHDRQATKDFFGDLVFSHEEMRIVLGETAHAGHSANFA